MTTDRYHRQTLLPGFGSAAQKRLTAAKVLVAGAGGLGVPALQYLAGAGVGTIGIVDGDVVSLHNLHRQVLYTTADIGQPKAVLAAQKLAALNPEGAYIPYLTYLTPTNALEVIRDYDLVLDATDNFAARYLLNDACVLLGKPLVYGAAHQYEGHVSVFNWQGGPTYRCLYPTPPAAGQIPDCNTGGVLGMVPGIIGCYQALEAVKLLTGIGTVLSGLLQVHDFRSGSQYQIALKRNPATASVTALQDDYGLDACGVRNSLSPHELQAWRAERKSFLLLDVREPEEAVRGMVPGAQNVPVSRVAALSFDEHLPVVLYCQSGTRSAQAALFLQDRHPRLELYELTGGYGAWQAQFPAL